MTKKNLKTAPPVSDLIFSKKFTKREGPNRQHAEVRMIHLERTSYEVAVYFDGSEFPDEFKVIKCPNMGNVSDFAQGVCMGLEAAGFDED